MVTLRQPLLSLRLEESSCAGRGVEGTRHFRRARSIIITPVRCDRVTTTEFTRKPLLDGCVSLLIHTVRARQDPLLAQRTRTAAVRSASVCMVPTRALRASSSDRMRPVLTVSPSPESSVTGTRLGPRGCRSDAPPSSPASAAPFSKPSLWRGASSSYASSAAAASNPTLLSPAARTSERRVAAALRPPSSRYPPPALSGRSFDLEVDRARVLMRSPSTAPRVPDSR